MVWNSIEPYVFDNLPNIQFYFFNIDIDNLCHPQKKIYKKPTCWILNKSNNRPTLII
jgi:hypothetical protein